MKTKVKVTDINGKVIEGEVKEAAKDHLKAQQTFKPTVQKNKKRYNRKPKHKKEWEDD